MKHTLSRLKQVNADLSSISKDILKFLKEQLEENLKHGAHGDAKQRKELQDLIKRIEDEQKHVSSALKQVNARGKKKFSPKKKRFGGLSAEKQKTADNWLEHYAGELDSDLSSETYELKHKIVSEEDLVRDLQDDNLGENVPLSKAEAKKAAKEIIAALELALNNLTIYDHI